MTTPIRVRFENLPYKYLARRWSIPNHHHNQSFEPIPADITCIYVSARSLFINRQGDRRPHEISLDEARTWGFNGKDDTEVIYAQAKTADASKRFCLRMVLNVEHSTSNTHSTTFRVCDRLVKDAKFHSTHLLSAEGLFVPLHYGMWVMDTGEWAGKWCGIPWNELVHTKMNTEANRILVGRTFEALHDYGIDHGGLRCGYDFRHVIIGIHAPGLNWDDLLNGKAPCYIVDFAEARATHQCTRKVPILPLDAFLRDKEVGCVEITDVLVLLKFMRPSNTLTRTSEALEWHAKYSELYPDVKNSRVLIAQRARLYHDMPPVYPYIDYFIRQRRSIRQSDHNGPNS
ncbi:hypothetical protein DFH09DRAFT_1279366 [Mycena vulgaris]|nr:hypothetical protein DFH09DRAFT_1279366 [Mycena vulgaris]